MNGENTRSILIVEDDKDIAHALEVRMQSQGLNTHVAFDAAMATQIARQKSPDLVILDIGLPGGDGFDVADRVRRLVGARTPLIFITANGRTQVREKAERYNPVAFFQKPYSPAELVAAVGSAL